MEFGGLFLGLGNPGATYAGTRHNFGFMTVDALLEVCRCRGHVSPLSGGKKKYEAWKCRLPLPSSPLWIVAKPLSFMNRSGEAAIALLQFYRIPLSCLVVAHDELDLPFGRMRLKKGGGAAGHNGVRSITETLGSPDFFRLRLGIGKPEGYETTSYVLGRFSSEDVKYVENITEAAVSGFLCFCKSGFTEAQQQINGFTISSI